MPKPEGLVRIAALGGSTTFGLFVGADEAFPAQLERRLSEELAPRAVEVINLGCPGWASDRIVNIFDSVLEFDPDFIVVYSGHNEMLEGDVGPMAGLTPWSRLRIDLLRTSTLFQWLNHVLAGAMRSEDASEIAEEMAAIRVGSVLTFDPREVDEEEREPASDSFIEFTVERYARNIARMIERAHAAGVGIAFVHPVGNLRSPPSLSAHAEGFDRVAEFKAARNAAKRAIKQSHIAEAIRHLDHASEISPRHAMIHYRRGFVLQQIGRIPAARKAFQRAVDHDLRTHRMTTAHAAALAEVTREAGLSQVDLRPDFHARLTDTEAKRLFFDHLHPTVAGHAIVAERILAPVNDHLRQIDGGSLSR
jgi:lysophospholipase L1-like esterase